MPRTGDGWHPDCDFDADARGRYLDAVIAATHGDGDGDIQYRDRATAIAANPCTATYLDLCCCVILRRPDGCCGDAGDCADPHCGGARPA